ncbi:hypothetical protein FNV43_RR05967 [Rhamnella rubrinervis]|uniref:Uncharacterized protein n=1 Tax=Rhamnella rubrinervis TaxID=2594499 RepID=A0A8K0MLB8_9ROSA|nr:hypothetical protein FNV43_RR05967 [Rhamnella rubrinervis]
MRSETGGVFYVRVMNWKKTGQRDHMKEEDDAYSIVLMRVSARTQEMANVEETSNPEAQVSVPVLAAMLHAPTVTLTMTLLVNHAKRPEKFNDLNFKRRQHKMLFHLTTPNLARFLTGDADRFEEEF